MHRRGLNRPQLSVPLCTPRPSSNRTGGFPASGFPRPFTARAIECQLFAVRLSVRGSAGTFIVVAISLAGAIARSCASLFTSTKCGPFAPAPLRAFIVTMNRSDFSLDQTGLTGSPLVPVVGRRRPPREISPLISNNLLVHSMPADPAVALTGAMVIPSLSRSSQGLLVSNPGSLRPLLRGSAPRLFPFSRLI